MGDLKSFDREGDYDVFVVARQTTDESCSQLEAVLGSQSENWLRCVEDEPLTVVENAVFIGFRGIFPEAREALLYMRYLRLCGFLIQLKSQPLAHNYDEISTVPAVANRVFDVTRAALGRPEHRIVVGEDGWT